MFHIIMVLMIAALVALDQITKHLATVHLAPIGSHSLIDGVFSLHFHINTGMAFGLFQGGRWFFVIFTILALGAIGYFYATLPKGRLHTFTRVMLAMLIAGALGNFIDRVRQGYVVDFFFFNLINFPIFNVADIFIVVSAIGIIVATIVVEFGNRKKADADV